MSNIYLLLGIEEGASLTEIKRSYARLTESLNSQDICCPCTVMKQVQIARQRLSESFEQLKDPEIRKAYESKFEGTGEDSSNHQDGYCRPKIGQMLVAAGLITLETLDTTLEIQHNTKTNHIPLGELLVAAGYISTEQLNYYLRQQKLLILPPDHPDRWGQRLIELG
ncbi:MAG: hypothetical protein HY711_00350, partial [Candidatus Melainabacteria bacterium]|nr:hypothetical protein [Candidatus Melainabacteria bacterium]